MIRRSKDNSDFIATKVWSIHRTTSTSKFYLFLLLVVQLMIWKTISVYINHCLVEIDKIYQNAVPENCFSIAFCIFTLLQFVYQFVASVQISSFSCNMNLKRPLVFFFQLNNVQWTLLLHDTLIEPFDYLIPSPR